MKRAWLFLLLGTTVWASGDLREQLAMATDDAALHSRIEILRRILDEKPSDADALRDELVRLWLEAGDFEMADAAVADWPDVPPELKVIVTARRLASDDKTTGEAIALLSDYVEKDPGAAEATGLLVEELQQARRLDDVVGVLSASPLTAGDPVLLLARARAQRDRGNLADALRDAGQASARFPEDSAVQREMPAFERLKEAMPHLTATGGALEADPSDLSALVADALWSDRAGLTVRARQSARRATDAWPESVAALLTAYWVGASSRDAAWSAGILPDVQQADPAAVLDRDKTLPDGGAPALAARAGALLAIGQSRLAKMDAAAGLALSPADPACLLAALRADAALGDLSSATAMLAAYEQTKPGKASLASARLRLAEAMFAAGRLDDALQSANASLDVLPAGAAFRLRAAIYERTGRPTEAAADIKKSENVP